MGERREGKEGGENKMKKSLSSSSSPSEAKAEQRSAICISAEKSN